MKPTSLPVIFGNLLLAIGIGVAGWPSSLAAFQRLPVDGLASAVREGHLPSPDQIDELLLHLSRAAETSPAAREDTAFALLLDSTRSIAPTLVARARLDQSVAEFRQYLSDVPGDALAWAGLTDALISQGHQLDAAHTLKMSMITSPRSPSLLLWRCKVGLDLFYLLDGEGRVLLEQQFSAAMEKSPVAVVDLARAHHAVTIVRSLLGNDPDSLASFDERLAHTQS